MNEHDCVFDTIRPDYMILAHAEFRILHLRCVSCLETRVVQAKFVSESNIVSEVSVIN